MWFEERSWSNQLKMSSLTADEWRDIWSFKAEFILAGLSYLFATTNFLNLPHLALENGGLAFLAAYAAALLVVVLPLLVMELSVGQLTGRAPVQALYNVCPTLKGVGVSQIAFSLIVLAYMTRYLAWICLYLFHLCWTIIDDRPGLPWLSCQSFPELQSPGVFCREAASVRSLSSGTIPTIADPTITTASATLATVTDVFSELTTTNIVDAVTDLMSSTVTSIPLINDSNFTTASELIDFNVSSALSLVSSSVNDAIALLLTDKKDLLEQNRLNTLHEESALSHFMRTLENPSSSIADFGEFQIYFLIAQGAIWLSVFIIICFGVRWLGKVIVFTFTVSFVLLLVLSGRCLFLSGAVEMFQKLFYETTDWEKLYDYMVWKAAVEQAILATGIGFGAFITIGSYNKKSNNLVRDSVFLVFGHIIITILQLSIVISLVGFVHYRTGLSPRELIEHGENQMWQLIVYMSFLPHTKIFTAMLLILCAFGLLNVFSILSLSVLATLEDALGERWTRCFPRFVLALFVALLGAGTTVYFATQAGRHAYELTSGFIKYFTLEVILAAEIFAVGWFYCAHSLGKDLKSMLESSCAWCFGYFLLIFTYLLPSIPIAIAVLNVMTYSFENYSLPVRKWNFSELVGLAIAIAPLLPIPLFAIVSICRYCNYPSQATKFQRLRHAFRSPMHYELMKGESTNDASRSGQAFSPRYSAAAPGYVLLPQQSSAPLAQPENYNLEAAHTSGVNAATTVSTTTTASANTANNGSRVGTVERHIAITKIA